MSGGSRVSSNTDLLVHSFWQGVAQALCLSTVVYSPPVLTRSPFGTTDLPDAQNVLSNAIHASVIPHVEEKRLPFVKHKNALCIYNA